LPLALSTKTSIREKRMATVAYSSAPSRQASERSPCSSFTPEMRFSTPLRAFAAMSSEKYETISGVAS
jgi:hypothetical protein